MTEQAPNQSAELLRLCGKHRDQALKPEEADQLSALLIESPEARRFYLKFMGVTALLESRPTEQTTSTNGHEADENADVLLELLKLEEQAPLAVDTKPTQPAPLKNKSEKKETLSLPDAIGVAGYLLTEGIKAKAGVIGSIAAVIVITITLFFVFSGDEHPASLTTQPDPPTPQAATVATLTATHNAVWDQQPGEDFRPGTQLAAGQRLTLTAGFATITTARGAVASIEAPCTVELIDHNNALYLHAGKLVGLCETDASKGFTVKTPHGDVVDLGTKFGVNVTPQQLTATVFTGEVTLTPPGGQAQPITTKQTAQLKVNGNDRRLVLRDQLASGFDKVHAVTMTKTISLPGTGQAIAVGKADPYWSITAIDGLDFLKPVAATVADPAGYETTAREKLRFLPNDPAASNWITPMPRFKVNTSVQYQTTFDVTGMDLQTVALDLKFLADKQVTGIAINGRPVEVPAHGSGPAFIDMTELVIREGFIEGPNTLSLTVQRYRTPESTGFWTGLRAELELTGRRLGVGPNE